MIYDVLVDDNNKGGGRDQQRQYGLFSNLESICLEFESSKFLNEGGGFS